MKMIFGLRAVSAALAAREQAIARMKLIVILSERQPRKILGPDVSISPALAPPGKHCQAAHQADAKNGWLGNALGNGQIIKAADVDRAEGQEIIGVTATAF